MSDQPVPLSAIGLMSGTSLDGIDICYARFVQGAEVWDFELLNAETIPYSSNQQQWLSRLEETSASALAFAHMEYGRFLGDTVSTFIQQHGIKTNLDLIASHGHTLFHQPEKGFTFQLGHGGALAAKAGYPVVSDFRSSNVALGGEGAPLVPIGDELLFHSYNACINLGGFANISYADDTGNRVAFDVCPFNLLLNRYARELDHPYDPEGSLARKGNVNTALLDDLNALEYYQKTGSKSLGTEWIQAAVDPLLNIHQPNPHDALRTLAEHMSLQLSRTIPQRTKGHLLLTGGGTYNTFFVELLSEKLGCSIALPPASWIDFKEALIFAFLGVLRWNRSINVRSTYTGASRDQSSGCIYLP